MGNNKKEIGDDAPNPDLKPCEGPEEPKRSLDPQVGSQPEPPVTQGRCQSGAYHSADEVDPKMQPRDHDRDYEALMRGGRPPVS